MHRFDYPFRHGFDRFTKHCVIAFVDHDIRARHRAQTFFWTKRVLDLVSHLGGLFHSSQRTGLCVYTDRYLPLRDIALPNYMPKNSRHRHHSEKGSEEKNAGSGAAFCRKLTFRRYSLYSFFSLFRAFLITLLCPRGLPSNMSSTSPSSRENRIARLVTPKSGLLSWSTSFATSSSANPICLNHGPSSLCAAGGA